MTAWKDCERQAAKELCGERVCRGDDFSKGDVDVRVPDFPEMRVDAKYRKKHAHHSLFSEIQRKYCATPEHEAVLITKHHNQRGALVTIRLEYFGELLNELRLHRNGE